MLGPEGSGHVIQLMREGDTTECFSWVALLFLRRGHIAGFQGEGHCACGALLEEQYTPNPESDETNISKKS